tara:strand:- start:63 stop:788 length:726 start_codon:yes stop_codon:yes gene_type:complete
MNISTNLPHQKELEQFNSYGLNFKFDPNQNTTIPNFDWYINSLKNETWEPETFKVFQKCANRDKIALDIGAWMGATTIALSKHFKKVYSLEPDFLALDALRNNIKTNGCNNVEVIPHALYSEKTKLNFGTNPDFKHEGMGASTSQINSPLSSTIVETTTFDLLSDIIPFDEVGFVKVDIEGAEEYIMDDLFNLAVKYKWDVLLELHPQFMSNSYLERFNPLFDLSTSRESIASDQVFFSFK